MHLFWLSTQATELSDKGAYHGRPVRSTQEGYGNPIIKKKKKEAPLVL